MGYKREGKREFNDRGPKRTFGGGGRSGGRSFGRGSERQGGSLPLFDVVCAECGRETQVPFKPTGERPVLCRDCFKGNDSGSSRDSGRRSAPSGNSNELREINEKLDKIMEALDIE